MGSLSLCAAQKEEQTGMQTLLVSSNNFDKGMLTPENTLHLTDTLFYSFSWKWENITDKHVCVHTHTHAHKLPSCTKLVQLINLYPADLKKGTGWELQVKFYLRQNEDYIPANSTLNSPKKLLRGRGGWLVYM